MTSRFKERLRNYALQLGNRKAGRKSLTRVGVLCYHSVHPRKSFATPPGLFEAHLRWLRDNCDVISFRAALAEAGLRRDGRPAVAITFDDGLDDNYEHALPLLGRYGATATFFLTSGLIDGDPRALATFYAVRGNYDDIRPLTWHQVRTLRDVGMEIGAHTHSHCNLARLDSRAARYELERSKAVIEDNIGARVDMIAYPYGRPRRNFTAKTMALASEAGYALGATAIGRLVGEHCAPLAIPRFTIVDDDVATLADKLHGIWDVLGVLQEWACILPRLRSQKSDP